MATKKEIFEALEGRVSDSSIQKIDDESRVAGKYCCAVPEENGVCDVFICNPADIYRGLGQRKVRKIAARLRKRWRGGGFHELTREDWGKVQGTAAILENLAVLGIKKRRRVSEEHRRRFLAIVGADHPESESGGR